MSERMTPEEIHHGLLSAINMARASKGKRQLELREAQNAENARHKTGLFGQYQNPFATNINALNYLIESYP